MSLVALIPVIGPIIQNILNLIPNPNERARAEAEFNKQLLAAAVAEGQETRSINKAEAEHRSVFVAGWRPAIGWVCALALAFNYLVRPFWMWASSIWWPDAPAPPTLDDMLWELMLGMLGIGTLRTLEKVKGIAR